MHACSVVVLEIALVLETISRPPFEGLGLILESSTFLLGLVLVSDTADSGFLIKTGGDHIGFICCHDYCGWM